MSDPKQSRGNYLWAAARAFRVGMNPFANELLAKFANQLEELFQSVNPQLIPELNHWLSEMVQAQERSDGLRVADILEYEIGPRLFPKKD